ncbi:MAG: PTS sugar transporter subunit IIA [Burkholderiaceae bacterium]|jgi:PTS system mannose-specific IIA component
MIGIVLVGHAPLASAMLDCVSHILGTRPTSLLALDVLPDEPAEQLRGRILSSVQTLGDCADGLVFLTDLFGATPSNAVVQIVSESDQVKTLVVSGCNVPMLLRTLTYRHQSLQSLGEKIVMGGRNGIVSTGGAPPQRQKLNAAEQNASTRDHHQQ